MEGLCDRDDQIWNIFVPSQLFQERSGSLLGIVTDTENLITINGISHYEKSVPHNLRANYIGQWSNHLSHSMEKKVLRSTRHRNHNLQPMHVQLILNEHDVIECSLHEKTISGGIINKSAVVIIFSPASIMSSYFLSSEGRNIEDRSSPSNLQKTIDKEEAVDRYCIGNVIPALIDNLLTMHDTKHDVRYFSARHSQSLLQHIFTRLTLLLILFLHCCGRVIDHSFHFAPSFVISILSTPSSVQLLMTRYKQAYKLLSLQTQVIPRHRLILYTTAFQQIFDSLLGLGVCLFVIKTDQWQTLATFVIDWADGVAQNLTELVQWLMGAPAGLKLNAQLTHMLGHFFIYHIYLWTDYLTIVRTMMPDVLWYLSLTGVFGFSFQLCLIQDILSMLTLHIYCFYVYAARIFHLQTYTLGSLWRLFRGKKWNVLRSRVDSASYNTDRLFVGTLLFTTLLFLLPTTLLYYSVFTMMRLVILFVQGLVSHVVHFINTTPVLVILLKVLAPKYVAGSVTFCVYQHSIHDKECVALSMQTTQLPLSTLKKLSLPATSQPSKTHTLQELIGNLVTGRLIYPWLYGKPSKKEKSE